VGGWRLRVADSEEWAWGGGGCTRKLFWVVSCELVLRIVGRYLLSMLRDWECYINTFWR
jgi:hypothetical protein